MRISNFGIWVLHVKVTYWRILFVTSFLCSLKFLLFHRIEYPKRCLWKKIEIFLWLSFCDMTVTSTKTMYRPCNLDHWPMKVNLFQWIEYNPISILYKFQIDISSNSREIKYQNIGWTHRHTHRHTRRQTDRVKTIPRNLLRERGNKAELNVLSLSHSNPLPYLSNTNFSALLLILPILALTVSFNMGIRGQTPHPFKLKYDETSKMVAGNYLNICSNWGVYMYLVYTPDRIVLVSRYCVTCLNLLFSNRRVHIYI